MAATKKTILKKAEKFLAKKGTVTYRACKLLQDGDFDKILTSDELAHLLNEGPGKRIKTSNLVASLEPLVKEDILKIKIRRNGRRKRYWYPGWLRKEGIEKELSSKTSDREILFFSGQDPWSDLNKNLLKIIEKLKGTLYIVDPYYGNGTFDVLEKFGKNIKIRLLSCTLGKEEQQNKPKFDNNLKRFKKEFKNIKIKVYGKFYELHDRYIIAENALVVVGHGIKDIANKESFIIFLPKNSVAKFLSVLKNKFESRWKQSRTI